MTRVLEVDEPAGVLSPRGAGAGLSGGRRQLHARPGRDAGAGRRVGLRQEPHQPRAAPAGAGARAGSRRAAHPARRHRRAGAGGRGAAADPGPPHRDDLPGPDDQPESGVHRRRPDRRRRAGPLPGVQGRGARPRPRAAAGGGHPRPRGPARRLSAPAQRRHAPAGDDRHRALGGARDPDRRRADHRARRDGAGADPGSARPAAGEPRHGGPADHPRPRHRGRARRPGGGHVRRPDRRGGADGAAVRPALAPYTQGLFASVPRITGPIERLSPIGGSVPPPRAWPAGCRFRPRCPKAFDKSETMPPLLPLGPEHRMRCWLAERRNP